MTPPEDYIDWDEGRDFPGPEPEPDQDDERQDGGEENQDDDA